MSSIGRYKRTIRHLTARQVLFQVWYRLRSGVQQLIPERKISASEQTHPIAGETTFTFLNQTVHFSETIDWNYARNGKLWTYHLNYFDTLNVAETTAGMGLALIRDFIGQYPALRDGREPYPTSRRLINWIQFLRKHQIQDTRVEGSLQVQTRALRHRLEYHLGGNHLLENGFALLVASTYLGHDRWQRKAIRLIRAELTEQILPDGGHYERSPAYHRDLLERLCYVLTFLTDTPGVFDKVFLSFLAEKARQMQHWLNAISFRNGDLPMVNDGISPAKVSYPVASDWQTDTYRMFRQLRYELLTDVGAVGPDHQPGHAHADSLSFLLYVDNYPVLIDTGTSTYEASQRRQYERSTAAHNTVAVSGQNSSEIWAVFRVGRRANTTVLTDTETLLTARHDGYRYIGLSHERSWLLLPEAIQIIDRVIGKQRPGNPPNTARFHAHPDVVVRLTDTGASVGPVRLTFASDELITLRLVSFDMAAGFNQLRPAVCVEVEFIADLVTNILL